MFPWEGPEDTSFIKAMWNIRERAQCCWSSTGQVDGKRCCCRTGIPSVDEDDRILESGGQEATLNFRDNVGVITIMNIKVS